MLVSYDASDIVDCLAEFGLQGHQNVGELRLKCLEVSYLAVELQGHQNVGELRQKSTCYLVVMTDCRVTRMLVSYDISTAAVYPTAIVLPSKCRFVTKLQ